MTKSCGLRMSKIVVDSLIILATCLMDNKEPFFLTLHAGDIFYLLVCSTVHTLWN